MLLVFACAFVLLSYHQRWFESLDGVLYDLQIALISAPMQEDIVIVAIDDASLYAYGPWPWPRSLQADLLRRINAHHPSVVALDIIYAGTTDDDSSLVQAASEVDELALPMMIDTLGQGRQHIEVLPFSDLIDVTDKLGHVHVELDEDAIVRGTYLYQGVGTASWPHLMQEIAGAVANRKAENACLSEAPAGLNVVKCDFARLPFAGPPGTYPQVSAATLLTEAADFELLDSALGGRIVLAGLTATGTGDWVTSPTSGDVGPMSGVEFNANLLSAILAGTLIRPAPAWLNVLLAMMVVGACTILLPRLRPKQMLAVTFGLAALPLFLSVAALSTFWLYLPLTNATAAVALLYPLWSWRRHEIAWSFIQRELARIDAESREWSNVSQHSTNRRSAVMDQLETLLGASVTLDTGDDGTLSLRCSRGEPLQTREAALLRAAEEAYFHVPEYSPGLPGEILAAQIRRLELAAQEVREGRAMGLAGLSHMSNGALIVSAFGEVRFANAAADKLLNLSQMETNAALDALETIQPPLGQTWIDIARRAVFNHEPTYFEGHNEEQLPVFVGIEPLLQASDTYAPLWVVTLADLSAIREAQAQREEALAFLSHDIRSPLLSVLALIRGAPEDHPLLTEISRYTQKGLSTSEQFLQLSRLQLQSGFEKYDMELEQVLHNAVEQVFFLARDKNIVCRVDARLDPTSAEEGVWVNGNGELLERAFINLLSNAIKYSDAGTEVVMRLTRDETGALVTVRDQGYGIPEDEIQHIFAPFFRSAAPQLAEHRGAGLGLRFVKTVIDRHDGTIDVDSVWGEGTTFTVRLPVWRI